MHRNRYSSVVAWLVLAVASAAHAQNVGDISRDPNDPTNCSRWDGTKWVKISCNGKKGGNGYSIKDGGYSNLGEKQGKQGWELDDDTYTIADTKGGKIRNKKGEKEIQSAMKEAFDRCDKLIDRYGEDKDSLSEEDKKKLLDEIDEAKDLLTGFATAWCKYLTAISENLSEEDKKKLQEEFRWTDEHAQHFVHYLWGAQERIEIREESLRNEALQKQYSRQSQPTGTLWKP